MKIAFVKQMLDVFGPWATVKWNSTQAAGLFNVWPGKASLWEMTCALEADWYVISERTLGDYQFDLVSKVKGVEDLILSNTSGTLSRREIPFADYDLIITLDPILESVSAGQCMLAYFLNEHWDSRYKTSMAKPAKGYYLFLDHMLAAPDCQKAIPRAVAFPYMRAPDVVRSLVTEASEESTWVDWRTLAFLSNGISDGKWADAAARLGEILRVPVRFQERLVDRPYSVAAPPDWGDGLRYLRDLGRSRFYVSIGRDSGPGQGLCDALSAGCICFGEADKPYHRLACHPACLCVDATELPRRFRRVAASVDLQTEIRAYQDEALLEHFARRPKALLTEAIAQMRQLQ